MHTSGMGGDIVVCGRCVSFVPTDIPRGDGVSQSGCLGTGYEMCVIAVLRFPVRRERVE
jgi:hypothetical protein